METEIFILLVFWDYEIYPKQEDFPGVKFVVCHNATEFYEKALKKYNLTVVLINNKSTISDKGEGEINLTSMKKFFEDYEIQSLFFNKNEQNLKEEINKSLKTKNLKP